MRAAVGKCMEEKERRKYWARGVEWMALARWSYRAAQRPRRCESLVMWIWGLRMYACDCKRVRWQIYVCLCVFAYVLRLRASGRGGDGHQLCRATIHRRRVVATPTAHIPNQCTVRYFSRCQLAFRNSTTKKNRFKSLNFSMMNYIKCRVNEMNRWSSVYQDSRV